MGVVRDLAAILLAVEVFVMGLAPLAMVGALVYGMFRLLQRGNLPRWLRLGHGYLDMALHQVNRAMAAVVRPAMWMGETQSSVRGWLHALTRLGGKR